MPGCKHLRWSHALAGFLIALCLSTLGAQQPSGASVLPQGEAPDQNPPGSSPGQPFKLHVFANLVQVPTLVLSNRQKLPPAIARESFKISLDSGPSFHPTQMRMQGDDQIALGVLFDAGGDQPKLLASVKSNLAQFAQRQLHPGDSVTVYGVDCKIVRSLWNGPPDPEIIDRSIANLFSAASLHGSKGKPACRDELRLWDAIVYASNALGKLPGRRVLLVVSAGNEAKSVTRFERASEFVTDQSVAVFAFRNLDELDSGVPWQPMSVGRGGSRSFSYIPGENMLDLFCGQNGGLVLKVRPEQTAASLDELATFLRNRYILEFPRPDTGSPGAHSIEVTIAGKGRYLIRATGVEVPLPDAATLSDPNTIHSQPSPAVFGTRRVLTPTPH